MATVSTIRRALYRTASILADVQAATKGPGAMGKRLVRKEVWKSAGRGARWVSRGMGAEGGE